MALTVIKIVIGRIDMIDYEHERSDKPDYFYSQFDENLSFHTHIHNSFEFVYCYEGSIQINIGEKSYELSPGQATLIFPLHVHSYVTEKFSRTALYVFSSSYIPKFYEHYKLLDALTPVFDFSDSEKTVTELATAKDDIYLLKSYFYLIASRFANGSKFVEADKKNRDIGLEIIKYVSGKYTESPSLAELCKILGYSYNYISGFIKHIFHTNFMQLVNSYRVSYAQQLLHETSLTMSEISGKCGYDSIHTFNRNFMTISGMTPTDYRNMNTPPRNITT